MSYHNSDKNAEGRERQRRVPPAVLRRRVDMEHPEPRFGECAGPANSAQRQFGSSGLLQGGVTRAYAATMDSVRLVLMTRTSNSVSSIMYRRRKRNPRRCGSRCKVVAAQITCLLASTAYLSCKHPSKLGGKFILAAVVVSDPLDTWPFAYLSMNFGTAQTLIFRARFA
jgi:hypothetical protein